MNMKLRTRSLNVFLGALLFSMMTSVFAETVIIVNKDNSAAITSEDIAKIYLGKMKSFPGGTSAKPVDHQPGTVLRVGFLDSVVGKTESQMKAYWSRLIFTGKGVPAKVYKSDDEVKKFVAANPDAIGYIDASAVDDTVKVVHKFWYLNERLLKPAFAGFFMAHVFSIFEIKPKTDLSFHVLPQILPLVCP